MTAQKRWLGLDRIRGAAIAQENSLMAPPIRGSSIIVVVGRVICVSERPEVNVFTAV